MSLRDFRRWLPVPAMARPRRPLSMSASQASWSIRFSLRMMISGAPSSSSRLSRLLRLMTRRYRSLRSEVANRPPSSWTIGRRSGGMTGSTDRIIHSGRVPRAAERLDEPQPLDGLLAAHPGRGPDLAVEVPRERLHVHLEHPLADRLGAHARGEQAGCAAHAAAVLAVELPEVPAVERRLGQQVARLELADLVLGLADLLLEALRFGLEAILLGSPARRRAGASGPRCAAGRPPPRQPPAPGSRC